MLVDTHAHLDMEQFEADRQAVLERARKAGVSTIITIASTFESNFRAKALAEEYSDVYCTVGIHPHDSRNLTEERLRELCLLALADKVVAWGEVGLDYYRDRSPREAQQEAFRQQIRCAHRLGLPLIIHNRDAHEDTLSILAEEEASALGGVFHCFSGDRDFARRCLEMGFYISVAGPLTYPQNGLYRKLVADLPTDRLLVETDSPYLPPQARRGKRNEPAFLKYVAEALAQALELTAEDVARITARNVWQLFGIGPWEPKARIVYSIRDSLYINLTNRCTNQCTFCSRTVDPVVKGHNLKLEREPTVDEVIEALGAELEDHREVVFCGYGEPTLRLEELKTIARWLKDKGYRVRLNTNGHGSLVHGRNIARELQGLVDACSVSLNAQDAETYETLCRPREGKKAFEAVKRFIAEAKEAGMEVSATVVDVPYWVDVEACRKLALQELGVAFRVRRYREVG